MKLFLKTIDEAYSHAVEVDTMGRTVVMICEREAAEFARDQIHGYGADWRLPRSKGSMSATLEPARAAVSHRSAWAARFRRQPWRAG